MMTLLLLLLCIFLFIFPFYAVYKPPNLLIRLFSHHWPDVLFHLPITKITKQRKIIALTFDDAPSRHTEEILAILERYGAKATFFVIGSQVGGKDADGIKLLKRIVEGGHELGNHAWRDEPSRSLTTEQLKQQIIDVDEIIASIYSSTSSSTTPAAPSSSSIAITAATTTRARMRHKFFRPGSGVFSTRMRHLVKDLDYTLALGSVYPHDPQIPYPKINAAHVKSMVRPGSIVIIHDRRSWTAPMLESVLSDVVEKRGFQVMPLGKALDVVNSVGGGGKEG